MRHHQPSELIENILDAIHYDDVMALRSIYGARKELTFNDFDSKGQTALHIAALEGSEEVVSYLCENGDVNLLLARDTNGCAPLDLACQKGHLGVVKLLCDRLGDHINDANSNRQTALHLAVIHNKPEIVAYLCTNKSLNLNPVDDMKHAPLHLACAAGDLESVSYLCQSIYRIRSRRMRRDYITQPDNSGFSPFWYAINNNRTHVIDYFIKNYWDIVKKDSAALKRAVMKGNIEVLKVFPLTDKEKCELLYIAAGFGHLEIVKYFCETLNVPVTGSHGEGKRALHVASEKGHLSVVEYLCEHDDAAAEKISALASKKVITDDTIALHRAIKGGHRLVVEYLDEKKDVDINQMIEGRTAFELALQFNHFTIVQCLLSQSRLDLAQVARNANVMKRNGMYERIKTEVTDLLAEVKPTDPLFSLANYFNQWHASHLCWQNIHPNRYIFAYMILKAKTQPDRDNLIERMMASGEISSWFSHNTFHHAIRTLYEKPMTLVLDAERKPSRSLSRSVESKY